MKHILVGIGVLILLSWVCLNDMKKQCDGSVKTYASLGHVYTCNNFKENAND